MVAPDPAFPAIEGQEGLGEESPSSAGQRIPITSGLPYSVIHRGDVVYRTLHLNGYLRS